MRRAWQIASLVSLTLAALSAWYARGLSLTDALGPGPGFFPFWLALVGGGLALVLLVQATRGTAPLPAGPLVPDGPALRRVGLIVVALTGVAVMLEPLGFRLVTAVFLVVLLVALGIRRWWVTAVFALLGSFGVFHVFYHWLKVPLPIGLLGI